MCFDVPLLLIVAKINCTFFSPEKVSCLENENGFHKIKQINMATWANLDHCDIKNCHIEKLNKYLVQI